MVSAGVGRGFDRFLATYFTNRGFVATKSAGSKGLADVVAVPIHPGGSILLVQAKAGDLHRISPREWNGLYKLAESNPCITALAAFRGDGVPIFRELLGYVEPRTRSENLPWKTWIPPNQKPSSLSPAPSAEVSGQASTLATAQAVT